MVGVKLITKILPEYHECRRSAKKTSRTVRQGDPRVLDFLPVCHITILNSRKLVSETSCRSPVRAASYDLMTIVDLHVFISRSGIHIHILRRQTLTHQTILVHLRYSLSVSVPSIQSHMTNCATSPQESGLDDPLPA